MKLGIGSYTLTWSVGIDGYERPAQPLDAFDLLELARESGLTLVQYADNLPLTGLAREERNRLAGKASEYGIEIEAGTRGTDPDHLLEYLSICGEMNIHLLRTLITTPDMGQAEEELRRVLPEFEAQRVMLGIENHGLHTAGQLADLLDRLNSPCVGCVLDTVNSFGALEGPERVFEVLIPYTVNLHVKDFDIRRIDHQMGYIITGTPAGSGRLDIPGLLNLMGSNGNRISGMGASGKGHRVNAVLELWTPFENSVEETIRIEREWMARSLDYLKPLFRA